VDHVFHTIQQPGVAGSRGQGIKAVIIVIKEGVAVANFESQLACDLPVEIDRAGIEEDVKLDSVDPKSLT